MESIKNINRNTNEGKLLFAAIIELTTKLHTNKTPEEVIKLLWEIHYNTEEVNREKPMVMDNTQIFDRALTKSVNEYREKEKADAKELGDASNIVLKHGAGSFTPDDFKALESLLVNLYKYRMMGLPYQNL